MEQSVAELREKVLAHHRARQPVAIVGHGSKAFYGRAASGEPLCVAANAGIIDYQPTELVITARAGTPLTVLDETLAQAGQRLGFDPPHYAAKGTIGGAIAAGLAGPARPWGGAVQDFVLGCRVLTGEGKVLDFGGRVIKNVAGFDISRLLAGSLGCLGVLLEVALKVLPLAAAEKTVVLRHDSQDEAIRFINELAGKPLPLTAACWFDGATRLRLAGSGVAVEAAVAEVGGDVEPQGADFWAALRDLHHAFFQREGRLLKGSVAPATGALCEHIPQFIDWGGAQRWAWDDDEVDFTDAVRGHGGHVTIFRGRQGDGEVFPLPSPALMTIHQRLKARFDPNWILNPHRMYRDL